jgi:uncharacterized membrane protein
MPPDSLVRLSLGIHVLINKKANGSSVLFFLKKEPKTLALRGFNSLNHTMRWETFVELFYTVLVVLKWFDELKPRRANVFGSFFF